MLRVIQIFAVIMLISFNGLAQQSSRESIANMKAFALNKVRDITTVFNRSIVIAVFASSATFGGRKTRNLNCQVKILNQLLADEPFGEKGDRAL